MIKINSKITGYVTKVSVEREVTKEKVTTLTIEGLEQAPDAGKMIVIFEVDTDMEKQFRRFIDEDFSIERTMRK